MLKNLSAMINRPRILMRAIVVLSVVSFVLAAIDLRAQGDRPVATISVKVNVVDVYVTARDKKGNIVRDLAKDDFVVEEDGVPQNVQYFSRQNDLPLTLGLLVDTSPSESKMIEVEREASRRFFDDVLRPEKDKAFLIHFDFDVELLQDLTSSREKLEKALRLLKGTDMARGPGGGRGNQGGGGPPDRDDDGGSGGEEGISAGANTRLADAIYLASNEIMKPQKGRKAIILLGDGDNNGSKVSMAQALQAANLADTLVYSIRIYDKDFGGGPGRGGFRLPGMGGPMGGGPGGGGQGGGGMPGGGGGAPPERSSGKKRLQEIASRTGGAYFEVSKKLPLDEIYSRISEELRSQYSLGYVPDPNAHSGYRRIKVTVKRKGISVQAREGYYGESKPQS